MTEFEHSLTLSVGRLVHAAERVFCLVTRNHPVPLDRLGIELCGVESVVKNLRSLIREKGPMEAAPNTVLSRVQVVEQDTRKATGLYGDGDRSDFVLRILAVGKRAYAEDGLRMPRPTGFTQDRWDKVLAGLPEPPDREGKPEEAEETEETETAETLQQEYGGYWGEVLSCSVLDWQRAVAEGPTREGYWAWAFELRRERRARERERETAKMAGEAKVST